MTAQILAVVVFLLMFILIITEVVERHIITLGCGLLTLILVFGVGMQSFDAILETINVQSIFTLDFWYAASESAESTGGVNWATIIFIAGMMIMVEGMARVGFFRWLCMCIAKLVKYKVIPIFLTFMVLSAILSMFIDSITVILFLAAVTIELSRLLKFNPVPMILTDIFCANLGGSATMCGDPPNIIIGTSLGYSFSDFVMNTGSIVLIAFVFIVIYFYFAFRKELKKSKLDEDLIHSMPKPSKAILSKKGFTANAVIFAIAIVLLITHAQTGLTVAFIGVFISILSLLASGRYAFKVLKGVDYMLTPHKAVI